MKLTLVNKRDGKSSTFVIKGWLRGLLSLCLLGAPVAFGCFGYQVAWSDSPAAQIADRVSSPHVGSHLADNLADLAEITLYQNTVEPESIRCFGTTSRSGSLVKTLSYQHSIRLATAGSPSRLYKHGRIIDPATYFSLTLS